MSQPKETSAVHLWHCGEGDKPEAPLPDQLRIAIIDDDQSFRDSLRRLLTSLGYSVSAYTSAAQFMESAELERTACVVADVHMPHTSGIDLYRNLVSGGRPIPTILVTGYPDEVVKARMIGEGVQCYLRKPLEEAHLIKCLQDAVR